MGTPYFHGEKNAGIHPEITNKESMFMISIQYRTRNPIPGNKTKTKKGIEIGKEEKKMFYSWIWLFIKKTPKEYILKKKKP